MQNYQKSDKSNFRKWALIMTVVVHAGFFSALALSGQTEKDDQIIQVVKDWFQGDKDHEKEAKKKSKTKQA